MMIVLRRSTGPPALFFPALAGLMPSWCRGDAAAGQRRSSRWSAAPSIVGPTIGALLVVTVGPGWALAVDALTWLVRPALLLGGRSRRRTAGRGAPATRRELREGWSLFVGTTWLWVVVLAFGILNAIHTGAFFTLGPAIAKDTIGEQGWGLRALRRVRRAAAMTAVLLRRRLERPLLLGMLGISLSAYRS